MMLSEGGISYETLLDLPMPELERLQARGEVISERIKRAAKAK